MTTQQRQGKRTNSGMDDIVSEHLKRHPDFFDKYPEILAAMHLQHDSGAAVSLIERQVSILREQNLQYRHKLDQLIENAKANDALHQRLHQLTLGVMECDSLTTLLDTVRRILEEEFAADEVALRFFVDEVPEGCAGRSEFVVHRPGVLESFETLLSRGKPVCGEFRLTQKRFLFATRAEDVMSMALVPLCDDSCFGLLAIGSYDEAHFNPGQGIDFLAQLAGIVSRAFSTYLE